MVDDSKELSLDGYARQFEDGESPSFAINAGFKIGFYAATAGPIGAPCGIKIITSILLISLFDV